MKEILKPLEKYIEEVAKFVSKTGHDLELTINIKRTKTGLVIITCDNVQIFALYDEQEDKWYEVVSEAEADELSNITIDPSFHDKTDLF